MIKVMSQIEMLQIYLMTTINIIGPKKKKLVLPANWQKKRARRMLDFFYLSRQDPSAKLHYIFYIHFTV